MARYSRRPDLALSVTRIMTVPAECTIEEVVIGCTVVVRGPMTLGLLNERLVFQELKVSCHEEIFITVVEDIEGIILISEKPNRDGYYTLALVKK